MLIADTGVEKPGTICKPTSKRMVDRRAVAFLFMSPIILRSRIPHPDIALLAHVNPRFRAILKLEGGYVKGGPKTVKAEVADLGFHARKSPKIWLTRTG